VSNGSNLATSKHTAINDVVNDTLPPPSINRRYVVILEAGVEKFEVEFDPKNVNGPQNRVLAATEKLWSWLVDREMDKKVRLADAVALAEDILRLHEDNV
jgi:hypothetical protein